jgi:hypothetical protein
MNVQSMRNRFAIDAQSLFVIDKQSICNRCSIAANRCVFVSQSMRNRLAIDAGSLKICFANASQSLRNERANASQTLYNRLAIDALSLYNRLAIHAQ